MDRVAHASRTAKLRRPLIAKNAMSGAQTTLFAKRGGVAWAVSGPPAAGFAGSDVGGNLVGSAGGLAKRDDQEIVERALTPNVDIGKVDDPIAIEISGRRKRGKVTAVRAGVGWYGWLIDGKGALCWEERRLSFRNMRKGKTSEHQKDQRSSHSGFPLRRLPRLFSFSPHWTLN